MFLLADEGERARRRTQDRPGVSRRDARRRPAQPRRARRRQHAAGRRRRAPRHDAAHRRRRRRADRRARRGAAMNRTDASGPSGAPTIGTAVSALTKLRVYGARARADGGRARRRVQPLQLDRPARPRRGDPAHALLHGEGRGAPRSRPRPAHALVRRVLGPSRRVRSRRRAHHAPDRPRRARARALRRGDAAALRRARPGAARRGDGRDQRGRAGDLRRDLRLVRVAARQLQPVSARVGDAAVASTASRAAARATRRRPSRSSARSGSCGSGSRACTSSAGHATRTPPR